MRVTITLRCLWLFVNSACLADLRPPLEVTDNDERLSTEHGRGRRANELVFPA